MTKANSRLKLNPMQLPAGTTKCNGSPTTIAEAWMYEDEHGLDVVIQLPGQTITQRIPWWIVEGCVTRYRAGKTKGAKT